MAIIDIDTPSHAVKTAHMFAQDRGPVLNSLRQLRIESPDRRLFTWVGDDGTDERSLTVSQLAEAIDSIAAALHDWGIAPGDRVALVYPPGIDFITAFTGCLAAGVLPVPVYPPDPTGGGRSLATFARIVELSGARAALTNGAYDRARRIASVAELFGRSAVRWPRIPWYRTDRRRPQPRHVPAWHEPSALDEVAFLQFTSGSTAMPKGVMVTHVNIAHEIAANVVDLRLHEHTIGVFWIPQYHDMGLINVILSTVAGNSTTYLMSPMTFLRDPDLWPAVMSRVGATITSAPNFAYDLVVRKTTAQQRASWDLSPLEMAICAAEPVRDRTACEFQEAFVGAGLRPNVFFAAYGLAENTASVTNRGQGRAVLDRRALDRGEVAPIETGSDPDAVVLRGCGRSSKPGDEIRIIDPDTATPCQPMRVGEIWVRSTTTTAGYWGMPALTAETFQARPADEDRPYLRTGDIGFVLDGELYVTGRIKDLMIVRGRNVHPGDLEDSIRDCHPLLRPGGILVFATGDGAEQRIVVLAETRQSRLSDQDSENIWHAVRGRVVADHQLTVDVLVIGRVGLAEKTTSGKLRRRVVRESFQDGSLLSSDLVLRTFSPTRSGDRDLQELR